MVKVEVDKKSMAAFQHNIKQLIAVTKEPVEDILKQQGRLFAVAAAKYTGRFGAKPADGKKHTEDVVSTISSTYQNAAQAANYMNEKLARSWRHLVRRRNVAKLQEMADNLNLSQAYGGKQVNVILWDRGNRHTRRLKKQGSRKTVNLVCDYQNVKKYMTAKKKEVGEAKSGWARAADMLGGTRGIPAFAKKKHHRTRGHGSVRGTGSKAVLTVAHYGKYGYSKTSMTGLFRHRTNMMTKDIAKKLKHAGRDAAKAQNQGRKISRILTR